MTGAVHDVLSAFMTGRSVAYVHTLHPTVSFAELSDAYFAAWAERNKEYSQRLSRQLNGAAMARGLSRAVIARRALETLAARDLIDAAASGRLLAYRTRVRAAAEDTAIPNFISAASPT